MFPINEQLLTAFIISYLVGIFHFLFMAGREFQGSWIALDDDFMALIFPTSWRAVKTWVLAQLFTLCVQSAPAVARRYVGSFRLVTERMILSTVLKFLTWYTVMFSLALVVAAFQETGAHGFDGSWFELASGFDVSFHFRDVTWKTTKTRILIWALSHAALAVHMAVDRLRGD